MFGTIAQRISQEATSNVGIVRGSYDESERADRTVPERVVSEIS
jgi:hypothetical protein